MPQFFNLITELVILKGIPSKETKAAIETFPAIAEIKRKRKVFRIVWNHRNLFMVLTH